MEYEIYVLDYNLGPLPFQQAVISTSSSEKAEGLLRKVLDDNIFGKGGCEKIGFEVILCYETGVKSDREKVIIPVDETMILLRANIINRFGQNHVD